MKVAFVTVKRIRNWKSTLGILVVLLLLVGVAEVTAKQSLELSVLEPLGIDRPQYPVTMGVPLPKSALKSTQNLRLEADGKILPLQARTMLTWPDGSIKWVLLDFQRNLAASQENLCKLFFGEDVTAGPTPEQCIEVNQTEAGLEVSTGPVSFVVAKNRTLPLKSASLQGRAILPAGSVQSGIKVDGVSYKLKATEEPVLEEPGPLRAVVKTDGKAVADDGKTSFDVTTRIYAYAGQTTLRIYFTLTNKIPVRKVHLEHFYMQIEPSLQTQSTGFIVSSVQMEGAGKAFVDSLIEGNRTFQIPTVDAPFPKWLPEYRGMWLYETPEQVQQAAPQYTIIPGDEGQAESLRGGANWAILVPAAAVLGDEQATVTFACRHPWHNAPKEIDVTSKSIRLELYPEWAEPLEWYRGVAKTHEIVLDLRPAKADQIERTFFACYNEKRPVPQVATRNWILDTGAFGKIFRYQPKKYPWWEFVLRNALRRHTFNTERRPELGATILNYGDTYTTARNGIWLNNEMDTGFGLILQMVRTGYQKTMDAIEPIIHHQIDVDTIHDAEDTAWIGGQCYHNAKHGVTHRPNLCHEWLEGPLFYYLLTGYKRAEEVALARADHFCRAIDAGWHRFKCPTRVQGYPLMALARMYECYRNDKYEKACSKILDWLQQWSEEEGGLFMPSYSPPGGTSKISGALWDGVIACALARHHSITGNPRSWNFLKKVADNDMKNGLITPEGFLLKQNNQFRDYFAPEPDFYFEALGYLTQKTGRYRYAKIGYMNLQRLFVQRSMLSRGSSDAHFYRYWLPALAIFDELGLLTDPKPW